METSNRFTQVSWLRELARDISQNARENVSADALVDYALDQNHPASDRIELPEWFDFNDHRLLCAMVQRRIA